MIFLLFSWLVPEPPQYDLRLSRLISQTLSGLTFLSSSSSVGSLPDFDHYVFSSTIIPRAVLVVMEFGSSHKK